MATGDFKNGANLDAYFVGGRIAVGGNDTTIRTVAAGAREKIASISLCNTGTQPVTVSVSLVPSGGTIDGTHKVLHNYTLVAGDTICHEDALAALKGAMMPAGTFVSVNASSSGLITWTLTGSVSS